MAKKRNAIKMSDDEVARFLEGERIMSVCTNGHDGFPHVTALWYVMRDGEPWIYTYGKSQKVRNLERDDRATLLVEAGHDYHELLGVMLRARAEIHREFDTVLELARELTLRYYPGGRPEDPYGPMDQALRSQAAKRVVIHFHVEGVVSWDHSKLSGAH